MASSINAHRAVSVGLSGGIGVGLPLAAVVATWQLADAGEVVRASALPFAVGALAGVGLLALSDCLLDRRAARRAAEEAEAASFTTMFTGAEAVEPHAATDEPLRAATGKRFARRSAPKGVPVIARAVDALDEADAWAEIDAMLNDGSPISCDPARSKDMYEIALDELRRAERARTGQTRQVAEQAPATAPVSPAAPASSVSPESTNVYLALAAGHVAAAAKAKPIRVAAPSVQPVSPNAFGQDFDLDEVEETSARDAAMASLYGAAVSQYPTPVMEPAATSAAPSPAPVTAVPSVSVADYSGHEATWAAALAILEEDAVPQPAPAPVSPSETAYVTPGRMAAVAEGGNATRAHAHVNTLLEEEFDRVPSSSVRRTSREFLRVIQGGTAAMPRLQAQQA